MQLIHEPGFKETGKVCKSVKLTVTTRAYSRWAAKNKTLN